MGIVPLATHTPAHTQSHTRTLTHTHYMETSESV